jgi:hypothetical protein
VYLQTPIGFGIACFCMLAAGPGALEGYQRFHTHFSPRGEINIPIDRPFTHTDAFTDLVKRLQVNIHIPP